VCVCLHANFVLGQLVAIK